MKRTDPAQVLADLENLISETRDCLESQPCRSRLALVHLANARECLRAVVDSPSLYETNQPARRTASEHFQEARRIARGIP